LDRKQRTRCLARPAFAREVSSQFISESIPNNRESISCNFNETRVPFVMYVSIAHADAPDGSQKSSTLERAVSKPVGAGSGLFTPLVEDGCHSLRGLTRRINFETFLDLHLRNGRELTTSPYVPLGNRVLQTTPATGHFIGYYGIYGAACVHFASRDKPAWPASSRSKTTAMRSSNSMDGFRTNGGRRSSWTRARCLPTNGFKAHCPSSTVCAWPKAYAAAGM
jgi:hypothetical protein